MTTPRDVIQISLGSCSNAVTAHTLNLQGLAATASGGNGDDDDVDGALCDAQTTHRVENNCWVPRVMMIDEGTNFFASEQISSQQLLQQQQQQQQNTFSSPVAFGSGLVPSLSSQFHSTILDPSLAWQFPTSQIQQQQPQHDGNYDNNFLQTASKLAYSPYSRYYNRDERLGSTSTGRYNHPSSSLNSNDRHVNWDELENEEEEEEQNEADEEEIRHREQRRRNQWQRETEGPLQRQLDEMATKIFSSERKIDDSTKDTKDNSGNDNDKKQQQTQEQLHWMDYWMPPYSLKQSKIILPFTKQSQMINSANWEESYSFHTTNSIVQRWKNDELYDNYLRKLLEESDSCQGIIITTQGSGIYAGLTTSLLYELQQEVKSAGRIIYHIQNENEFQQEDSQTTTNNKKNSNNNIQNDEDNNNISRSAVHASSSSNTSLWQPGHVYRFRRNVGMGMSLADFSQNAHLVIPIRLPTTTTTTTRNGSSSSINTAKASSTSQQQQALSLFQSSAQVALALESVALPIRLTSNGNRSNTNKMTHQIGLQNVPFFGMNGIDSRWGSTTQRITVNEFISSVKPSNQYSVLELDELDRSSNFDVGTGTRSAANDGKSLWEHFLSGTSLEHDIRMRDGGRDASRYRPRDVVPGEWLQPRERGGILRSLSIMSSSSSSSLRKNNVVDRKGTKYMDRSLHHHFALSTAVRPSIKPNTHSLAQYLTCLVQGMGIRYRPERSMCTVVDQTIGQLVTSSGHGAAGSYWKHITALPSLMDSPVVAVLGNTTRIYTHLDDISYTMNQMVGSSSQRYRGYHNRDVINGIVPELEDCQEALSECYNVRDIYQPPDGSGLLSSSDDDE